MADQFITELNTTTTVKRADLLVVETDPAGTPETKGMAALDLAKGWIEVPDSWLYASATTITVPTNATLLYQKGWGVRLKQGGAYKYFYMTTVAATLLTVTGGTDYTVANAAITDVAVCPSPTSAFGFPGVFGNTTTIHGAGGSAGTYAETVNLEGKFSIFGRRLSLQCSKIVTNKGSWSGNVVINLPVAPNSIYSGVLQSPPCWWASGGAASAPKAVLRIADTTSVSFIDLINGSFFDWSELATNDTLILDTSYWI